MCRTRVLLLCCTCSDIKNLQSVGLCMADESVDDGDSMDNSELPPVQLRVEPAATALAAAQAARASREADARRLVALQKRRRCEEEPMGAAPSLYVSTAP